jgi:hypothetical protein
MTRVNGLDAARLREFFLALPQGDRLILLLTLSDGLTPHEAGAVLQRAEAEIAARLAWLLDEARRLVRPGSARAARKAQTASASRGGAAPLQAMPS